MIGAVTLGQQIGVSNTLGLCFSNPIHFPLLQHQLRRPDLTDENTLRLLQAGGILSQKVAEVLDTNRSDPKIQRVTNIFMAQLKRLVADPENKRYADLKISDEPSEDRILLRYMENAGWRVTDDFGALSIVSASEAQAIAEGVTENIFHPRLVIAGAMQAVAEPITNGEPSLNDVGTSNGLIPSTEGAMILFRGAVTARETPLMSYHLLRETVFQYLARSRFKAAADLILSITDEFVLTRLVLDFYDSKLEKVETALAFGMTFAQMPAGSVAQILMILNGHVKPERRAKLDRWLVWGLAAIRPEEVFTEPVAQVPLPKLSIILGTLIEHPKSRALAARLLRIGLDEHHPDYELFRQALRHLNYHYDAFLEPYAIIAGGFKKIFDEKLAAAKKEWVKRREVSVSASIFEPPPDSLATRQEMVPQFQKKFSETEDESKELDELATQILLTLPAADIWQVVEADRKDAKTPAERLALLLENQSPEIVADFFPAWVRSISNEVTLSDAGHALVALWKSGERGEALVTHTIAEALKNRDATAAMQRLLSQIGTGDLLDGLVEIYEALTDLEHPHPSSLASALNSLEMFFATGVLKPEDLRGQFREQAIAHAFGILKYGRVGMTEGTYVEILDTPQGGIPFNQPAGDLDFNSGEPIPPTMAAKCDDWALGALVKLRADWKPVTDYLLAGLPTAADLHERIQQREKDKKPLGLDILTADEKRFFDALEAINPEVLVDYYTNLHLFLGAKLRVLTFRGMDWFERTETDKTWWEALKLTSSVPFTLAPFMVSAPVRQAARILVGRQPELSLENIFGIFPLSLLSLRRFIALELLLVSPYFKQAPVEHNHYEELVEHKGMALVLKRIYGEELLSLLSSNFLWRCARKPFVIPGWRHLQMQFKDEMSKEAVDLYIGAEELIPVLIHLAFSLGTTAAHQALVNFYYEQRGEGWFKPAHEDLLIQALVRLERQEDWKGPHAKDLYAKYYQRDPLFHRDPKIADEIFHALKKIDPSFAEELRKEYKT